jgi:hypothetical protein
MQAAAGLVSGRMASPAHYRNVARLLREEAARPGVPKDQVVKAISLAEYSEMLAANPYTEAADRRFA